MEKLLTLTEVMGLGLSKKLLLKNNLTPFKFTKNYNNLKQPTALYKESDILNLLKDEKISAQIQLNVNRKKYRQKAIVTRQNTDSNLLIRLINEIRIMELPYSVILNNAILSLMSNGGINYDTYIKTILPKLTLEAKNNLIARYIVHNLIEFCPTYCRLRGVWHTKHNIPSTLKRKYMESIVLKATYIYPECEEYLINYLNELSGQKISFDTKTACKHYKVYNSIINHKNMAKNTNKTVEDLYVESKEYEEELELTQDKFLRCKEIISSK